MFVFPEPLEPTITFSPCFIGNDAFRIDRKLRMVIVARKAQFPDKNGPAAVVSEYDNQLGESHLGPFRQTGRDAFSVP